MKKPDDTAGQEIPQVETPLPPGRGLILELGAEIEIVDGNSIDVGTLDLWIGAGGIWAADGVAGRCDGAAELLREIAAAVGPILKKRFKLAATKEGAA